MDLVYIYGPSAAGKLTIARELALETGYRLFHNHLSIEAVKPVFDFDTEPFWKLVHSIRLQVLEEAASHDTSLIYTGVYAHPRDLPLIQRRFAVIEERGGRVCPVQLTCSREELMSRVGNQARAEMGKIATVEALERQLDDHDVLSPIPGIDSLCIDNTNIPPAGVVDSIVRHYGLALESRAGK